MRAGSRRLSAREDAAILLIAASPGGPRATQPDFPPERLHLDLRAAVAESVGDAFALTHLRRVGSLYWQRGSELTVVGAHVERRIGRLRDRQQDIAVVGRERIVTAGRERAVIGDVSVDRRDFDIARFHP